jgi:threonine dehydrogenase-like Zn-dependent dehydrogenase
MVSAAPTTDHAQDHRRTTGRTMRAARLVSPGTIELCTVPIPEPGPGQVRIRIQGCGICGSNIPLWAGGEGRQSFTYPLEPGAPGHEPYGTIDALGEGADNGRISGRLKIGQRIAALSYRAFAEYDIADAATVVPLPDLLPGPFPGEAAGCAINIFRRCAISRGDVVAIVGIGFIGALLTQLAAESGARVIALSRRPFALDMARRMGAAACITTEDPTALLQQVQELTGGRMCDVVIEAVGQQASLDLAGELVRERGRLVIAGYHQDGPRAVNMQQWNWRGLDVINAHERDPAVYVEGMRLATEAIISGRLDPSPLYTHILPLTMLGDALSMAQRRPDGFLKALIMPSPREEPKNS